MKYFKTELIIDFIKEKGWSVRKFCNECRISMITCLKILNQIPEFSSTELKKVAKIMDLEICDLCYEI